MIRELSYYDKIILSTSGGKDSTAFILFLLESGARADQIEMWHQSIDGKGETGMSFFDWPATEGYVKKLAEHLGLALSFQWREYGFYGELFRQNERTKDVWIERNGLLRKLPSSESGHLSTRLKWPAKTANLNVRWCSAYLKIDVASRALNNIPELQDKRILFITGERREESAARAKYNESELHRTNSKRKLVHHWRPVIDWSERQIWEMMKKYSILPHPAYYLGFPRLSCRSCIFYSKDHWATLKEVQPEVVEMISNIEEHLKFTIENRFTVNELATMGKSSLSEDNFKYVKLATTEYTGPIITDQWELPIGAFGKGGGSI
ncbi:MAG: phosphoadenosine phosphosulfate reductase family protein [Paludibacter sp.]|nr:phosphoadenosine phosphosulfate reductase family protein [Paludibacter sp.]